MKSVITFAGLFWIIGLFYFIDHVSSIRPETTLKTDAIVVFTGESDRIKAGFSLLEQGLSPRLFISGVHDQVRLRDLLKKNNMPDGHVMLGRIAQDTEGNGDETEQWVREHKIKSIRLVTSFYHMPRALLELETLRQTVTVLSHPVVPNSWKKDGWRQSLPCLWAVFIEYNKLIVVQLRLWTAPLLTHVQQMTRAVI